VKQGLLAFAALAFLAAAPAAAEPLSAQQLKTMVENMGYAPKGLNDAASPLKFEIMLQSGGLDVYLALETSASGRYIWASAFLGKAQVSGEEALALLKQTAAVQPTAFWITNSGSLMTGMAIDNRDVTPAHLKFVFEKIAADVATSQSVWGPAVQP
jgi:hypothetical protein